MIANKIQEFSIEKGARIIKISVKIRPFCQIPNSQIVQRKGQNVGERQIPYGSFCSHQVFTLCKKKLVLFIKFKYL